jgi:predicted kinase
MSSAPRRSTLHLISGLPCSGKTTYATALHAADGAALFSLDRWLITAFAKYSIAGIGHEEHVRRVQACRDLIWLAARELLIRSIDVVLDDGFFLRRDRMRFVALANEVGAAAAIHVVEAPIDTVRARLIARNRDLPEFNFFIDPEMLRSFQGMYERPTAEEGARVIAVNVLDRESPPVVG